MRIPVHKSCRIADLRRMARGLGMAVVPRTGLSEVALMPLREAISEGATILNRHDLGLSRPDLVGREDVA